MPLVRGDAYFHSDRQPVDHLNQSHILFFLLFLKSNLKANKMRLGSLSANGGLTLNMFLIALAY